jgi:hypothetical protein
MSENDAPEVDCSAEAPQHYPITEGLHIPNADGLEVITHIAFSERTLLT